MVRVKHLGWALFAAAVSMQVGAAAEPSDLVVSRGRASITLQDIDTYVARVPKEQRERFID